jgi:phosphohistidine swiveling domain-containing protein
MERLEEEAVLEQRRRRLYRGRGNGGPQQGASPSACAARGIGDTWMKLSARQLAGLPCSMGMARGQARVIRGEGDLPGFRPGEIMVCDSLEPGMAVIVPLASAVVAEREGLLREGTAVARKYGLPYVSGVSDATRFIMTGDRLVVDGHLGIVIIGA